MDVFKAIVDRRSVRAFKSDSISEELLEKILEAAKWAPSAGNLQARDFILVSDIEVKKQLREAALDQEFIEQVPVNIIVCANEERSAKRYGERGRTLYCLQDATAAVQNILLMVHNLGLGACWVGAFNEKIASQVLNLPKGVRPIAIIPIGYPNEKPLTTSRMSLKDLVHINRYKSKA